MSKTLQLTLKREFFAEIPSGKKRTEWRKRKPYWCKRLEGKKFNLVRFRNGYASNAPEMLVEVRGIQRVGKGRDAEYAIRLGQIRKISRWRS
jgi:hypothetical protein